MRRDRAHEQTLELENFSLEISVSWFEQCEVRDSFDVMRLREHIKCSDGVKSIFVFEQNFQVARKRRGVAGDVSDAAGTEAFDADDGLRFCPCARRGGGEGNNRGKVPWVFC